jgi:hypothetical protein
VGRRSKVGISAEELVRLIDVAKAVADEYSQPRSTVDNIASYRKKTDEWTEIFDRAYKAIKATVVEEREKD